MDWAKVSELLAAYLAPLTPFLIKIGEGAAIEVGKQTVNKIIHVAQDTWKTVGDAIAGRHQESPTQILEQMARGQNVHNKLAGSLASAANKDPKVIEAIRKIMLDIRNVIYDCIVDGFMTQDLQELYLKMGVGFDDLVMSTNPGLRSLAMALLGVMEKRTNGLEILVTTLSKSRTDLAEDLSKALNDKDVVRRKANLASILIDRLTAGDLSEVYFRLGISIDELIRRAKAQALIEYAETRQRLPELIRNMWTVNPTLYQGL